MKKNDFSRDYSNMYASTSMGVFAGIDSCTDVESPLIQMRNLIDQDSSVSKSDHERFIRTNVVLEALEFTLAEAIQSGEKAERKLNREVARRDEATILRERRRVGRVSQILLSAKSLDVVCKPNGQEDIEAVESRFMELLSPIDARKVRIKILHNRTVRGLRKTDAKKEVKVAVRQEMATSELEGKSTKSKALRSEARESETRASEEDARMLAGILLGATMPGVLLSVALTASAVAATSFLEQASSQANSEAKTESLTETNPEELSLVRNLGGMNFDLSSANEPNESGVAVSRIRGQEVRGGNAKDDSAKKDTAIRLLPKEGQNEVYGIGNR